MFIDGQPGSFQKYQVDTVQALILKDSRFYQNILNNIQENDEKYLVLR